jgi:hypothetical protein
MAKFQPFYPALLVFVGAMCVAGGGFWQSWRQSNFSMEIRNKNEEIATLQRENAYAITGGDGFAEVAFQVLDSSGNMPNANAMPEHLLLSPTVIHRGKYPLYDVSLRFADLDRAKFDVQSAMRTYPVGNMTPALASIPGITIQHDGRDINFNIFFVARNGMWIQSLRMPWIGNGWARATKIERNNEIVFQEVSANFPLNEKGQVDWDRPAKGDKPKANTEQK